MIKIYKELSDALEILNTNLNFDMINQNAKNISLKYRNNKNDGKRLLTKNDEAISYALSRMPATYGAVSNSLKRTLEKNYFKINSVLDVGAGTGTATWAAYELLGEKDFFCYERENAMIEIGKKLMSNNNTLKKVQWKKFDIIANEIEQKADLVLVSYMINELLENNIEIALKKLWDATNNILVIIEPGTPHVFSNIKRIRDFYIQQGGNIIAPCTHEKKCPLPSDDWCSFSCRVPRTKIHKMLKDGSSGFEDEKYSYIAFSKQNAVKAENRVLRHPIINKGYSEFKVCTSEGIQNMKLSKKDGIIYKNAKKLSSGDSLDLK